MASTGDQMDFATESSSRSPAMQDIDLDLDLDDGAGLGKEDENMMEGEYVAGDHEIDYDDEMVDEIQHTEPVDEEIVDATDGPSEPHRTVDQDLDLENVAAPAMTEEAVGAEEALSHPEVEAHAQIADSMTGAISHDALPAACTSTESAELASSVPHPSEAHLEEREIGATATQDVAPEEMLEADEGAKGPHIAPEKLTDAASLRRPGQEDDGHDKETTDRLGDFVIDFGDAPGSMTGAEQPDDHSNLSIAAQAGSEMPSTANIQLDSAHEDHANNASDESGSKTRLTITLDPGNHAASPSAPPDELTAEKANVKDDVPQILVDWHGEELSLFALTDHSEHQSPHLLDDATLVRESLGAIFEASRPVLDALQDSEHELLQMRIPSLDLDIHEVWPDFSSSSSKIPNASQGTHDADTVTLTEILTIFYQLHHNDGAEHPDPLEIHLYSRKRPVPILKMWQEAANNSQGFIEVARAMRQTGDEEHHEHDEPSQEVAPNAGHGLAHPENSRETNSTAVEGNAHEEAALPPKDRATPPRDSHLEAEDFELEFDSPLKPANAAMKGNPTTPVTASRTDQQAPSQLTDSSNGFLREEAEETQEGDELDSSHTPQPHDGSDEAHNSLNVLTVDASAAVEKTGENEEEQGDVFTNRDVPDSGHDDHTPEDRPEHLEHEDHGGDDAEYEELPASGFEDDFALDAGTAPDEDDESSTLVGNTELPAVDGELLAPNEDLAPPDFGSDFDEPLDGDALDDFAYVHEDYELDGNEEAPDTAGHGGDDADTDAGVVSRSRKRSRSPDGDDANSGVSPGRS